MDGLRQKLESEGLKDVVYMVVNHQGEPAQRLHTMMAQRLSGNITLLKQDEQQPDVWHALGGEKDDFLIYDRCGRLTNHISLPYSIIGQGHIEGAIKDTYCKRICGECTHESAETPEECKQKADTQPVADSNPPAEHEIGHGHGHDHGHGLHHGHHHGHGHGHHGDHHGVHPHGHGHGSHDNAQNQPQGHDVSQSQHHVDVAQMQQVVHMQQLSQDAQGAPVVP